MAKPHPMPVRETRAPSLERNEVLSVQFEYQLVFTDDALDPENPALVSILTRREPQRTHRALFVVDRGVSEAWRGLEGRIEAYARAHPAQIRLAGSPLVLEGGERAKKDAACTERLVRAIADLRLDRQSFVVAMGGGAFLDVAGLAAAVAHRGIRLVRLPTTVLSQADSGVGVKNGVNAFGMKNFVGTFAPPFGVVCDRRFLETLPVRDRRSGMAEAVKVALVRDAAFFGWIGANAGALAAGAPAAVWTLVRRSAELHLDHIVAGGDPFELGSARPLDFGHWAAHKLESLTAYRLRHGEAVAIGIALDTLYAQLVGILRRPAGDRILDTLERLGFELWDPALDDRDVAGRPAVLDGIAEFREHLGGELTLTMLKDVGRGVDIHEAREEAFRTAIDLLRDRACSRAAAAPGGSRP